MRSACFGARSARSWITMRPLVVSITIAFFLSRLAGSDCASAGTAKASAARKAMRRIMETPDDAGMETPGRENYRRAPYNFHDACFTTLGQRKRYLANLAFRLAATEAGTK